MPSLLVLHGRACDRIVWLLLRLAVAIDDHRRSLAKHVRRLAGSLRRLRDRWLDGRGRPRRR